MSITDASLTDPASQTQRHSDADLNLIADLTVLSQMPYFTARTLIRLNCERWPVWEAYNLQRIAEARRQDDSRDWYFPIISKRKVKREPSIRPKISNRSRKSSPIQTMDSDTEEQDLQVALPPQHFWKLTGIWHSSAHHAECEVAHSIPSLNCLPYEWLHHRLPRGDILAIQGGLFLIKGNSGEIPVRRSQRLTRNLASLRGGPTISDTTKARRTLTPYDLESADRTQRSWTRLLVCNPLTKACRELPAANSILAVYRNWHEAFQSGVQATMLVDDEANSYRVILTCLNFITIYTSSSNSWNSLRFARPRPWYVRLPHNNRYVQPGDLQVFSTWGYHTAMAHSEHHLYFADIYRRGVHNEGMQPTQTPVPVGKIRLFEVDVHTGEWVALQEYPIRKYHIPYLNLVIKGGFPFDMNLIEYIEIVECNDGEFYAVVCALVHDVLLIGDHQSDEWKAQVAVNETASSSRRKRPDPEFMPLCFYIMQLQGHGEGDGVDHGVIRIPNPRSRPDWNARAEHLLSLSERGRWFRYNFFSCHARGQVIWVACEDCLLSYHVGTRKTTAEIIPWNPGSATEFGDEHLGFAYTPSLHMRP